MTNCSRGEGEIPVTIRRFPFRRETPRVFRNNLDLSYTSCKGAGDKYHCDWSLNAYE